MGPALKLKLGTPPGPPPPGAPVAEPLKLKPEPPVEPVAGCVLVGAPEPPKLNPAELPEL